MKRRKDIPAPQELPKPKQLTDELMVPLVLADGPRIFLNFLALHSTIPLAYREKISVWLHEYHRQLIPYIQQNYGYAGLVAADGLAQGMAEQFLAVVQEDYAKAEGELFASLENELNKGDDVPEG